MRPHTIIENMKLYDEVIDNLIGETSDYVKKLAIDRLNNCVTFDFGDIVPTIQDCNFGISLLENRVMNAPYPLIFITSKILDLSSSTLLFKDEALSTLRFFKWCPVLIQTRTDKMEFANIGKTTGELEGSGSPWYLISIGYMGMLYRKDIEKTHIPAPEKLNKVRESKRKPKINDVITIRMQAHIQRMFDEEFERFKRRSPCPHTVRGHVWTDRNGKVRWKAPYWRALRKDEPSPKPKNYRVKP